MVDYIKILAKGCRRETLMDNPDLDFIRGISESTGEEETKMISSYHHCKIIIFDGGTILFQGSIHKMYNSLHGIDAPNRRKRKTYKGFNGNFFGWHQLLFAIMHLSKLFDIPPIQMIVQNIEFGVNLIVPFDPQIFLGGLINVLGKLFEFRFNGHLAEVEFSQSKTKVYNKGAQYGMDGHVLRLEIKTLKMQHQEKDVGIHTVADLSPQSLKRAYTYLERQIQKIVYFDTTIKKKGLSKKDNTKIKDLSNPRYWPTLSRKKRCTEKAKLQDLIDRHSENLMALILESFQKNREQFYRDLPSTAQVQSYPSSIRAICTQSEGRWCPVTGHDISMQRKGSSLLSKTGLIHLEKTFPEEFCWLKATLLTGQPNKYEKTVYDMMAKQIRNKYCNNRAYYGTPNLFDLPLG